MVSEYKVNLAAAVYGDLDEIFSYITNVLLEEQVAHNIMREIYDMLSSLKKMPERFSFTHEPELAERGYRRAIVKRYVILYLVDKKNKIVNVARVFHGTTDYSKYI